VNQVTTMEPRRSITTEMATRYGMEPTAFEATLRATVFPRAGSKEEFAAFLLIAKEYKLNPVTREIYAFPKKGGGLSFVVSVDGWANIINSHPAANGMTFRDLNDLNGNLVAITCQMWRKDREHPIEATEYMAECKRGTDPWRQWPRRMLRHKAMVQAARYAFGFSGVVDQDDAERFEKIYPAEKRTPSLAESLKVVAATPRPAEPPKPPQPIPPQPEEEEDDDAAVWVDSETGEVLEDPEAPDQDLERERLWEAGREAAKGGMASLGKWGALLTLEERERLGDDYKTELTRLAKEASMRDEAAAADGVP
jgi:RecT family